MSGGRESGDGTESRTEGTEGPGESEKAPQERVSGPLRHSAAANPAARLNTMWITNGNRMPEEAIDALVEIFESGDWICMDPRYHRGFCWTADVVFAGAEVEVDHEV